MQSPLFPVTPRAALDAVALVSNPNAAAAAPESQRRLAWLVLASTRGKPQRQTTYRKAATVQVHLFAPEPPRKNPTESHHSLPWWAFWPFVTVAGPIIGTITFALITNLLWR